VWVLTHVTAREQRGGIPEPGYFGRKVAVWSRFRWNGHGALGTDS
jgi:hypothetical protein